MDHNLAFCFINSPKKYHAVDFCRLPRNDKSNHIIHFVGKTEGSATDVKLKKIMLTRPGLATALATTANKLGSKDPEAQQIASQAEAVSFDRNL